MTKTVRATVGAALLAVGLLAATGCNPTVTSKVGGTLDVRCGPSTKALPVDWYFPVGAPKGLVWLQHGFTESKDDWDSLARQASAGGLLVLATTLPSADVFGCTVQNLGNNTAFLNDVAATLAGLGDPASALGRSHAAAAKAVGRTGQALPQRLALAGHSAGGEAVLYVANRLRTTHPATFAKLGGLVLDDPVKSFVGDGTDASLTALNLTPLPIYAIASPKSSCNADQSGTVAATQKLTTRSFHGVVVTTGVHGDVFGTSANGLGTATCGTPKAANVAATQSLTLAWLTDELAGTRTATNYPGGARYQALVTAGTIATLP